VARAGHAVALHGRHGRPHRSGAELALWAIKNDEVFTYDIEVTRGTHLAHLALTASDGGGWRWWHLFLEVGRRCG
jgi:hypothetical protein